MIVYLRTASALMLGTTTNLSAVQWLSLLSKAAWLVKLGILTLATLKDTPRLPVTDTLLDAKSRLVASVDCLLQNPIKLSTSFPAQ
jgi:hypothetical protein